MPTSWFILQTKYVSTPSTLRDGDNNSLALISEVYNRRHSHRKMPLSSNSRRRRSIQFFSQSSLEEVSISMLYVVMRASQVKSYLTPAYLRFKACDSMATIQRQPTMQFMCTSVVPSLRYFAFVPFQHSVKLRPHFELKYKLPVPSLVLRKVSVSLRSISLRAVPRQSCPLFYGAWRSTQRMRTIAIKARDFSPHEMGACAC